MKGFLDAKLVLPHYALYLIWQRRECSSIERERKLKKINEGEWRGRTEEKERSIQRNMRKREREKEGERIPNPFKGLNQFFHSCERNVKKIVKIMFFFYIKSV